MAPDQSAAPAIWIAILTGAVTGLLSSMLGYVILSRPFVRVRVRDDLHITGDDVRVDSYVAVTNVRGRPVTIEAVFFLVSTRNVGAGMRRPRDWEGQFHKSLSEGQQEKFSFDRTQYPKSVPVVFDSADRIWPRRRWIRVKRRRLWSSGSIGWPWQRGGPTPRQIERAVKRGKASLEQTRTAFDPDGEVRS
jgi:hypothetical protein